MKYCHPKLASAGVIAGDVGRRQHTSLGGDEGMVQNHRGGSSRVRGDGVEEGGKAAAVPGGHSPAAALHLQQSAREATMLLHY